MYVEKHGFETWDDLEKAYSALHTDVTLANKETYQAFLKVKNKG